MLIAINIKAIAATSSHVAIFLILFSLLKSFLQHFILHFGKLNMMRLCTNAANPITNKTMLAVDMFC